MADTLMLWFLAGLWETNYTQSRERHGNNAAGGAMIPSHSAFPMYTQLSSTEWLPTVYLMLPPHIELET